ncbi:PLM2-like protein [Elsinoe fawcettii]|nr:PLM2-like protein [Elsinoe fawcettii]
METQNIQSSPPKKPSLLPAFEPLSSSPNGLPRSSKRKYDDLLRDDRKYYPTPVPTSSTGIIPSSSPDRSRTRPGLQRTVSSLTERAPLGAVPSLDVPANGEPIHMGRSSNSSNYQLPSNRLISRVHVRATYHGPSEEYPEGRIVVGCLGWNGCKVHYQGSVTDLAKGETFVSSKPLSQIMVDVQDTRVMLRWPRGLSANSIPTSPPAPYLESPSKRRVPPQDTLASSPPSMCPKIRSPVSISSNRNVAQTFTETFNASQSSNDDPVQVYEDNESADEFTRDATPTPVARSAPFGEDVDLDVDVAHAPAMSSTQSSSLSEPEELSEHDEENDPIVHSFGPFGENLLSKFSSFKSVASPDPAIRKPTVITDNPLGIQMTSQPSSPAFQPFRTFRESPVKNHVINQLAFSRVHSIPLTTIFTNVPAAMKIPQADDTNSTAKDAPMTAYELRAMLAKIPCVGTISREGKDAAGKPLEDEFYYLPDLDDDSARKDAVSVGKPPLRNVRKQHKQYYWKKPKY